MTGVETSVPVGTERHRRRRRPRGHGAWTTLLGVTGELLITAGLLLLAFLVWQLWWTDVQGNRAQHEIVSELGWAAPPGPTAQPTTPDAPAVVIAAPRRDEPPVDVSPELRETIATLEVPRWDGEPTRPISEGVDKPSVLDTLGIGHYPGTAMPGAVGNFAVAGHRTTYGKPLHRIAELEVGDPLVVRTGSTWYVYRVTSTAIVDPSQVQVIAPDPADPTAAATERMITLTTCHPMYSARERYIVHGVLDYWAPVADGFPAELVGGT